MKSELVIKLIEDLQAIDFYDRTMFNCGIINSEVLDNMLIQGKLLRRLELLDKDAYICYICGEWDVIEKYYSRKVDQNASSGISN